MTEDEYRFHKLLKSNKLNRKMPYILSLIGRIGLLLVLPVFSAVAVDNIQVLGLFKNKAVVKIDGTRRTLSVGEVSPEGVELVSADSTSALLEINGERNTYPLGGLMSIGGYTKPTQRQVQIFPDNRGMYFTQGSINGYPIHFLVDTGATTIAMNASHARRLGISFKFDGKPQMLSTASGLTQGYLVKLDKVKVGELEVRNVEAVVIDGGFPTEVLLGMSFLSKVHLERDGRVLRLRK
jgi:aspartyl protease family protein